jgi:hypothetical protein
MKIFIDARPATKDTPTPSFMIRLWPETNEEMGAMEWGMSVFGKPRSIHRVCNGSGDKTFHYAIGFDDGKSTDEQDEERMSYFSGKRGPDGL